MLMCSLGSVLLRTHIFQRALVSHFWLALFHWYVITPSNESCNYVTNVRIYEWILLAFAVQPVVIVLHSDWSGSSSKWLSDHCWSPLLSYDRWELWHCASHGCEHNHSLAIADRRYRSFLWQNAGTKRMYSDSTRRAGTWVLSSPALLSPNSSSGTCPK